MQIKTKKIDVSIERRILIGFITSTPFLKKISKIYNKNYFTASSSKKIAKWCLSFYKEYNEAPNKNIQDIYLQNKKEEKVDDVECDFIETVLSSLSDEWDTLSLNVDALVDQAYTYFSEKHLLLHKETVDDLLENKNFSEASKEISEFKPLALTNSAEFFNPFSDEQGMIEALQQQNVGLFKLPGALGKALNPQLYRGGFIGVQAPEKSGKSHFLQEVVMRALRQRCKVAFFELGDLSKNDRYCRIGSYIAKKPFNRDKTEDGIKKCRVPELIEVDGEYSVKLNEVSYQELTENDVLFAARKWIRRCGTDTFRVSVHSSDSLSITEIREILNIWKEEDGWVPDFIAIDYPDISKKEHHSLTERDNSNAKWKGMRRISQDFNALTMVVTQADAKSYGKSAQTLKNFSEDKRKYSHVTAMYAINQTLQEKVLNMYRLAPLLIREGLADYSKHVVIVHCLDLGRPYMFSYEVEASKFNDGDDDDDDE